MAVSNLLKTSSAAISSAVEDVDALSDWGELGKQLVNALRLKNGFYAYDSALLVRPLSNKDQPLGLLEWNAPDLWKREYSGDLEDTLFFAEDTFGGQFAIRADTICKFDPETGLFETLGPTFGSWLTAVTTDTDFQTGRPLMRGWQAAFGPLPRGMRLVPKIPFVLGGEYDITNLYASNDTEGILFRASLARQIRDVPDGGIVRLSREPHNTDT